MRGCRRFKNLLRDYCENSSLVGLAYMVNRKIHASERLFWLGCIIIAMAGSYHLIREYQYSFDSDAISLVQEPTRPQDKSYFPALIVCELGSAVNPRLTKYIQGLFKNESTAIKQTVNRQNVESYFFQFVYPNTFTRIEIGKTCDQFLNCTDCVKCPSEGLADIAKQFRLNCSELMKSCTWNGKPFNCCHYFQPVQTPSGLCYAMNSLQSTSRNGPHWFKSEISWQDYKAEFALKLAARVKLSILNVEDIPLYLMTDQEFSEPNGHHIQFTMRNIINDPGVRDIPPEYRKCRFDDEQLKNATYDYYSFQTCIIDCIKQAQLRACNCSDHNFLVKSDDKTPVCGYNGLKCLDTENLAKPAPTMLQPWRKEGLHCECLPSCTDHEIIIIEDTKREVKEGSNIEYTITQVVATEQFRRQVVRTNLDAVVAIGGILGLFMGASVLSGLEIAYFFLVRFFTSKK